MRPGPPLPVIITETHPEHQDICPRVCRFTLFVTVQKMDSGPLSIKMTMTQRQLLRGSMSESQDSHVQ